MRKRTIEKCFRFNTDEVRKLKDLSTKSGLTESSVIRSLLNSVVIKEMPTKEFYDAINQIRKIGVNINQIAHIANMTKKIDYVDLRKQLDELNQLELNIMEKYL